LLRAKGSNFIAGESSLRCASTRLPGKANGFYVKRFRVVSETLPEGEIPVASESGWRLPTLAVFVSEGISYE